MWFYLSVFEYKILTVDLWSFIYTSVCVTHCLILFFFFCSVWFEGWSFCCWRNLLSKTRGTVDLCLLSLFWNQLLGLCWRTSGFSLFLIFCSLFLCSVLLSICSLSIRAIFLWFHLFQCDWGLKGLFFYFLLLCVLIFIYYYFDDYCFIDGFWV